MRKIALVALATVVLAGCTGLATGQTSPKTTMVMVNTENPARPWIWIDQEPIIVRGKAVTIVWQIGTAGYEFPDNGIVFDPKTTPKDEFQCKLGDTKERQTFECLNRNSKQPARYKYTITLRATQGQAQPRPLDPTVVNDR